MGISIETQNQNILCIFKILPDNLTFLRISADEDHYLHWLDWIC
jgi:hypothetical protein